MIYTNLYQKFISSRPKRTKVYNDGLERHHIIPRSIGGSNSKDNIIILTPREHFIAHRILVKMYSGLDATKMALALHRMATGSHKLKYKITSRTYQYLRELRSKAYQDWLRTPKGIAFRQRQSERYKNKVWGRHKAETRAKISKALMGNTNWRCRTSHNNHKGPNNPAYGVKWTDERRAKFLATHARKRAVLNQ